MNQETFDIGSYLKTSREQQGMSVASAAKQTTLTAQMIDKMEENQFKALGAPVFVRGYLVQYAKFLKLDEEKISNMYNKLGYAEAELRLNSANIACQSRSYKQSNLKIWLVVLPLCLLAGAILLQVINPNSWLMTQFKAAFSEEQEQRNIYPEASIDSEIVLQVGDELMSNESESLTKAESPDVPSLTSLTSLETPKTETDNMEEGVDSNTENVYNPSLTDERDSLTASPVLIEGNNTAVMIKEEETVEETEKVLSTEIDNTSGIEIVVQAENWIEIRNKSGKIISSRIYQQGETIDLPLDEKPYDVKMGRPEVVVLQINGKQANLTDYLSSRSSSRKFRIE